MNALLNKLLGLSSMGFGDPGVQFGFARPLPAWLWVLVVLMAGLVSLWSYSRLAGSSAMRFLLAALRGLVLLLLVFLISGPQLIRPNERIEKDWVIVLLDRSASMTIADAPADSGRQTREEQLRAAVQGAWPAFEGLARDRTVVWLGFDSGVYDLKAAEKGLEFGTAAGRRTSLGAALDQALARAAARPVSGVVILSDGRSSDEPGRAAIRRLQAEHIPVFPVALGSPDPIADLAVAKVDGPAMAFVNDTVPISVDIERLGGGAATVSGKVQLIDKPTGLVLDEQELPAETQSQVTLTSKPDEAGKRTWLVKLVPTGPDLIQQNNQSEVAIELVDRPLRVLQLDGYPRWEYRFVKNLLLREKTIRSASLLLASNRQYLQEGEIQLDALPSSPEEWAAFDVIVMGDLPGAMFSREQLEQLKEHVAIRGAGLLWIGGPAATPGGWRDTPLADLLPFSSGSGESSVDQTVREWGEPVVMVPAPAAVRLNLLELGETPQEGWPLRLSDPHTGWSQLYYAQKIEASAVKPTAEILATFAPVAAAGEGTPRAEDMSPAVLSMRYGAGRVLYVGTDEIWRWRYARGEALNERFWLPLIRLQGRESLARSARTAALEVSPRRPEIEQPVRIAVTLLDQALLDSAPNSLTLRLKRPDDQRTIDLTLVPESAGGGRGSVRSYATTWLPTEPGKYRAEPADALLSSANLSSDIEVTTPDDELRHPETDHALLTRLARQTEGRDLTPTQLSELPTLLPNHALAISGTPDVQPLWDRPLTLALFLLLLTLEWVGRRLIRLS